MNHRPRNRHGFTLIELLVVIAIIAILAGILIPTVNKALDNAKNTDAKSVCTSLVAAIQAFNNDYGKLPIPLADHGTSPDKEYFDSDSQDIILVLTATSAGINLNDALNPRKKVYFDTKSDSSDGTLTDPWGAQYRIILDTDYDGKTLYDYPGAGSDEITSIAVVYSMGKDGSAGEPGVSDDILSYEAR